MVTKGVVDRLLEAITKEFEEEPGFEAALLSDESETIGLNIDGDTWFISVEPA